MTIKATDFIKNCLDVRYDRIDVKLCCICKKPVKKIVVKHGYDKMCIPIFEVKQYCEHCENNGQFFQYLRVL